MSLKLIPGGKGTKVEAARALRPGLYRTNQGVMAHVMNFRQLGGEWRLWGVLQFNGGSVLLPTTWTLKGESLLNPPALDLVGEPL